MSSDKVSLLCGLLNGLGTERQKDENYPEFKAFPVQSLKLFLYFSIVILDSVVFVTSFGTHLSKLFK